MTGSTNTGNRIKVLKKEAAEHQRAYNAARRLSQVGGGAIALEIMEDEIRKIDTALAEADALRHSGQARLEDIQVYEVERTVESKKGKKTNKYFYASWRRPGGKVFNKYLGSTKKIDRSSALEMARRLKAADLGILLEDDSGTS